MTIAVTPGREMELDGILCRAVRGDLVPKRWWVKLRKFQGRDRASIQVVSHYRDGKGWTYHDYNPGSPFDRGGLYEPRAGEEPDEFVDDVPPERALVWVPVEYLEREVNAWGEVTP